ncbi:MAG: hypothetical protein JST85_20385 [Acidobacteria bacterium]|nr:hypothetical protein [Acidobacteriota bacterium]
MNKSRKREKTALPINLPNTLAVVDVEKLQQMYADLSLTGQELFEISLGTQNEPDQLKTTAEIHAEIARRRGNASQ